MVLRSLLLYPYDGNASTIEPHTFKRLKRRSALAGIGTWAAFIALALSTRWWASPTVEGSTWTLVVVLAIYLPINHATVFANLRHRMKDEQNPP